MSESEKKTMGKDGGEGKNGKLETMYEKEGRGGEGGKVENE